MPQEGPPELGGGKRLARVSAQKQGDRRGSQKCRCKDGHDDLNGDRADHTDILWPVAVPGSHHRCFLYARAQPLLPAPLRKDFTVRLLRFAELDAYNSIQIRLRCCIKKRAEAPWHAR